MKLHELDLLVGHHSGEFICEQLSDKLQTKIVPFKHRREPPIISEQIPELGKLRDFYETFGSLQLYVDEMSGDTAIAIANPEQWEALSDDFGGWLDDLDEDEKQELLPAWIDDCRVIGELPHSGNYLLMPMAGEKAGFVFEFEHDGFEFIERAKDLEDYIQKMLNLDSASLTAMAAYMRFIEDDSTIQWWIREMIDNHGYYVSTEC